MPSFESLLLWGREFKGLGLGVPGGWVRIRILGAKRPSTVWNLDFLLQVPMFHTKIEIQNLFCTVLIDGKGAGSLRRILSTIWSCAVVMQALLWPRSLVIHCVVNRPAFPRHLLLDNPLVTLQTELLICSFIIIASSSQLLLRSIKQENIHNSSFLTFSIRHPLKLKGKKFTCNLFDMKSCCNLSGAT